MASVIYYDQQIPDVVCLLFSMTSNRASLELRQCLVAALKLIMKKNKDVLMNNCDRKNSQVRAIPVSYIQPNLSLLLDSDPGKPIHQIMVKASIIFCYYPHINHHPYVLAIRADFALLLIIYLEQISDTDLRQV
jgi:hypothetical protein